MKKPKLDKGKIQIVYLLGAGSSGSTVLGAALGRMPGVFFAGELNHYERMCAFDLPCTCGESVQHCQIWSSVHEAVDSQPQLTGATMSPAFRAIDVARHRGRAISNDTSYIGTVRKSLAIYQALAEATGASTIVDSSKDPVRFHYLCRSGLVRIRPLIVVRGARAYMNSQSRRLGRTALRSFLRWVRLNELVRSTCKLSQVPAAEVRVSYDNLVAEPHDSIKAICHQLNIPYTAESTEEIRHFDYHDLGGTNADQRFLRISADARGHDKGGWSSWLVYSLFAGRWFDRRYGVQSDSKL